MQKFTLPIKTSRRGVTFNWKQFHTLEQASEIVDEANEILNSIK